MPSMKLQVWESDYYERDTPGGKRPAVEQEVGPMTNRQFAAQQKREIVISIHNARVYRLGATVDRRYWFPCIGCYSGHRPGNQGNDYCDRCLKQDQGLIQ